MSKKVLGIVKKRIKQILIVHNSELSEYQLDNLTNHTISLIDWDNSALMHKDLSWIVRELLNLQ